MCEQTVSTFIEYSYEVRENEKKSIETAFVYKIGQHVKEFNPFLYICFTQKKKKE